MHGLRPALSRDLCGACRMDRLGGIGIHQCSEIVPHYHSLTRYSVTLCSQYTLCLLRVSSWLCWTLMVLFTRQPCPADMEPSEGLDPSGAMIEMICLFIAALGCMTTILPCCRAFVLQCSSPPTMASSRFPLACLLLLTVVFALLASASTPNLPVLLVPPATSLPLASCCSTPHVPACKLPCSETFQFGGARVQELHGTSTCSLGESWDLKHAAEFEAPLYGLVWDDLPHSSPHDITPSPLAPAGPFLSFLGPCTTDCCSSLGPEQLTQASCVPCACRTCIAAPCKTPRMPTLPSILYENETYCQPSDNLWPYPSRSPVRVGVLEFEFFRHGTHLRALGLLVWPTPC